MGQSRDGRESNAAYSFQPGVHHQIVDGHHGYDTGCGGKVSLDEPANKHLSKSKIEGANGNADGATVQRLGAHASGLPTMFETYFGNQRAQSPNALLGDYGRLAYPPGSCYEYSNLGFAALGEIASNLTGTDFGTLMTQRVLSPLGLHEQFF